MTLLDLLALQRLLRSPRPAYQAQYKMLSAAQLYDALQSESALPTLALAVLAVAVLATHVAPSRRDVKLKSSYDSLPLLGNTLDAIYTQKDRLYDWMTELHERPWLLSIIGYPPTVVFEDVLKTHFEAFPKTDSQCGIFRDVFGLASSL